MRSLLTTKPQAGNKEVNTDLALEEPAVKQERLSYKIIIIIIMMTIKQAMNAYTLVGTMSHLGAQRRVGLTLPESQRLCTGRGHLSWDRRDKVRVLQAEKRQSSILDSKVPLILNKVSLLRNTEDRETTQSPESILTPTPCGGQAGGQVSIA